MQTSIEWLIDQLKSIPLAKNKDEFTNGDIMDIVNKAKEIYEEEMVGMYVEGGFAQMRFLNGMPYIDARQYYQETFIKE